MSTSFEEPLDFSSNCSNSVKAQLDEFYNSGQRPQRGEGKDFHQFGDGIIEGGFGQPAGAVRRVEYLVVEDREVEGQAKTVKRVENLPLVVKHFTSVNYSRSDIS